MAEKKGLERAAGIIFSSPARYGFVSEDDASDAFLASWRRKTAQEAKDAQEAKNAACATKEGGTFSERKQEKPEKMENNAYVDTSFRWMARSVYRDRRRREEREAVTANLAGWEIREDCGEWNASADTGGSSFFAHDSTLATIPASCFLSCMNATSRRILFLFIKCAWDADDICTRRVALKIGVPCGWLAEMADRARGYLQAERMRLDHHLALMNATWLRKRMAEKRIRDEIEGPKKTEALLSLERDRIRFERLLKQRANFRPIVPNSVVAHLLGVPKGTVDSGIYYLRADMERGKIAI